MTRNIVHGELYLNVPFSERFVFNPSGTLMFDWGIVEETGQILKSHLAPRKYLLVYDPAMRETEAFDMLSESLRVAEIDYVEYTGISPDPTTGQIDEGADFARSEECAAVIGLGGGSSVDSAKGIGVLLANPGSIFEYRGPNKIPNAPAPIIAIPTTAGTGSEVTPWIVATDIENSRKYAVNNSLVIPQLAILDPKATVSLPPHLTAGTGMDALTHAIEAYTNTCNNPISEQLALEAIRLVGRNLRRAFANGFDRTARTGMLHASLLAGMAFSNAKTGIVHDLSMLCGGRFHSPHGATNAAILPHVMEFSYIANPLKYREIAICLGEKVDRCTDLEAAQMAAVAVKRLVGDLNMVGLRSLGAKDDALPEIAENIKLPSHRDTSPRLTTAKDKLEILKASMEDVS